MTVITQIKIEKGLANTESKPLTDKGKQDASLSMEDKISDSSDSDAEEVAAEDEESYDLDVKPVAEEVAVSDLYDFYWDKSEECFAVDQIWAVYYYTEGMPKRYARINEVYSPFKVDVTWLEYVSGDMDETAWKRSGLPVACGKFKLGKTIMIDDIRAFSHKVFWKISVDRSYNIYPRRGQTWALYKNWDIKWSSDPGNHREYEYEFVEVLSDYTYIRGISVSHLVKLKGFVGLFKPTKSNGMASFQIPSNEMLRFSHRVPSFRTNGKERKGIPEGYYELDPCSLPSNLEEISETVDGSTNSSLKSISKEKQPMLQQRKTPDAEITLDGNSPGGIKSARMPNRCYLNPNEEKRAAEASDGLLDESKATSVSDGKKNAAAHTKEMSPDGVSTVPGRLDEQIPCPPTYLKTSEMLNTEFCNFNRERSREKFQTGQVWALYCKLDKLPKIYARIENIESFPVFKLTVRWLKSCDPPRGIIPWSDKEMPVSCGRFKVTSSEVFFFNASSSFSHLLSKVPAINNMYTIYPRAGEVWALYSKFRFDLMHTDLKKCQYDIVEILEVIDAQWIIISVLERVTGFKTVFKAKEKEGLDATAAIPWIDLYRFSHQVPTFMLSGAKYGNLRGFWELDPRALAVH